jgi:hypothetical protein
MIFVVFIIFLLCCISSFLIFDEIIRTQYKNHYSEWEKDGKPHGFFFKPKEVKSAFGVKLGSWLAMQRRCFLMNWKTPQWAFSEPKILRLIFWYRVLGVFGFLVWLCFVYLGSFGGR